MEDQLREEEEQREHDFESHQQQYSHLEPEDSSEGVTAVKQRPPTVGTMPPPVVGEVAADDGLVGESLSPEMADAARFKARQARRQLRSGEKQRPKGFAQVVTHALERAKSIGPAERERRQQQVRSRSQKNLAEVVPMLASSPTGGRTVGGFEGQSVASTASGGGAELPATAIARRRAVRAGRVSSASSSSSSSSPSPLPKVAFAADHDRVQESHHAQQTAAAGARGNPRRVPGRYRGSGQYTISLVLRRHHTSTMRLPVRLCVTQVLTLGSLLPTTLLRSGYPLIRRCEGLSIFRTASVCTPESRTDRGGVAGSRTQQYIEQAASSS